MSLKKKVAAAYIVLRELERKKSRQRSIWSKKWLLKRESCGAFSQIMNELLIEDPMQMQNFFRMSPSDFEELTNRISCYIIKQDTKFRRAISTQERLAITLRYFASGM